MCACVTVSFIGEIQTPAKSTGTHKSLTDSYIFTLLNEKPFKRVCELNAWDILYLLRHFDVFFFFLAFVSSVRRLLLSPGKNVRQTYASFIEKLALAKTRKLRVSSTFNCTALYCSKPSQSFSIYTHFKDSVIKCNFTKRRKRVEVTAGMINILL